MTLTKAQKFVKHRYELARRRAAVARYDARYEANMATLARIKADMDARREWRAIPLLTWELEAVA